MKTEKDTEQRSQQTTKRSEATEVTHETIDERLAKMENDSIVFQSTKTIVTITEDTHETGKAGPNRTVVAFFAGLLIGALLTSILL